MLEFLSSAGYGGIIGIAGSVISKIFNFITQLNEQNFKQKEWEQEIKLLQLQQTYQLQQFEQQAAIMADNNANNLRIQSYISDASVGLASLWVINILRLIRPILTIILIIMMGLIWFNFAQENEQISNKILDTILFCASSALTWWFGDRANK